MRAPFLFLAAALLPNLVLAQSQTASVSTPATAAPEPERSALEQSIWDIKHPFPWLSWGTDFRIRQELFNNILTLSPLNPLHEQDYLRFRARLWASVSPMDGLSFNARLATEPREWFRPAGYTPFKGRTGLDMTEGIFDNLNVQWKSIAGLPLSATVGRQDILWGDGWLFGDGTPFDGSWTYFVDAARVTYELTEQHTIFEAIGLLQFAEDDEWLPTINDQDRYLTEQNEKGAILSVANTSLKEANVTGYFIYKEDTETTGFSVNNPPPRGANNANIYTAGGRLNGLLGNHWKYWLEGAYQFGRKQDATVAYPEPTTDYRELNAFGGNARFGYQFNDSLNNLVQLSYGFLSGDNPRTGEDEMFDVLWGRWPYWSEMGLYCYAAETRVGQQANLHRFGPNWTFIPMKNMDVNVAYYALFAPEQIPTREANPALFTHDGNFRGHFVQAWLKYRFSPHLSGHLWTEVMLPGDYYTSKSTWYFMRWEILFTF